MGLVKACKSIAASVRDAMTSITGSEQSNASKKTEMGRFTDGDKSFSVNGVEREQANGAFFLTDEGITSRSLKDVDSDNRKERRELLQADDEQTRLKKIELEEYETGILKSTQQSETKKDEL